MEKTNQLFRAVPGKGGLCVQRVKSGWVIAETLVHNEAELRGFIESFGKTPAERRDG
jgi:hypothetical protein